MGAAMNKPWTAFSRLQHRPSRIKYLLSPLSAHEQAIREHVKRGYGDGLTRVAGLLSQENKL